MLPKLKILQVGDVHLPDHVSAINMDDKDANFPSSLKEVVGSNLLKAVFRHIDKQLTDGKLDALMFMGDLTSRGDIKGYTLAAKYITESLLIGGERHNKDIPVGIVPGNHDISRDLADPADLSTKFGPLQKALVDAGLKEMPVTHNIAMNIGDGKYTATAYLMNSCWGCGEETFIPAEFREPIKKAIDSVLVAKGNEAIAEYYDRQLDTPALSRESIEDLLEGIKASNGENLPIIVAHHNLLPQRIVRLAPYTELVNGGSLRGSLLDLHRPVLYLHGHIHADPVEIMSLPQGTPLVCISAPEVTKGFNVIEVIFSQNGLPLSVRIVPYRMDESQMMQQNDPIIVPLGNPKWHVADKQLSGLYASLLIKGISHWSDVVDIAENLDPNITEDRILEMVETLASDGSVKIENYGLRMDNWMLRAEK